MSLHFMTPKTPPANYAIVEEGVYRSSYPTNCAQAQYIRQLTPTTILLLSLESLRHSVKRILCAPFNVIYEEAGGNEKAIFSFQDAFSSQEVLESSPTDLGSECKNDDESPRVRSQLRYTTVVDIGSLLWEFHERRGSFRQVYDSSDSFVDLLQICKHIILPSYVFDANMHPLVIMCPTGEVETNFVVACIRRCLRWTFSSIISECILYTNNYAEYSNLLYYYKTPGMNDQMFEDLETEVNLNDSTAEHQVDFSSSQNTVNKSNTTDFLRLNDINNIIVGTACDGADAANLNFNNTSSVNSSLWNTIEIEMFNTILPDEYYPENILARRILYTTEKKKLSLEQLSKTVVNLVHINSVELLLQTHGEIVVGKAGIQELTLAKCPGLFENFLGSSAVVNNVLTDHHVNVYNNSFFKKLSCIEQNKSCTYNKLGSLHYLGQENKSISETSEFVMPEQDPAKFEEESKKHSEKSSSSLESHDMKLKKEAVGNTQLDIINPVPPSWWITNSINFELEKAEFPPLTRVPISRLEFITRGLKQHYKNSLVSHPLPLYKLLRYDLQAPGISSEVVHSKYSIAEEEDA